MGRQVRKRTRSLSSRKTKAIQEIVAQTLVHLRAGEMASARTSLTHHPEMVREHDFACYLAGLIHANLGECGEALSYYERAVALQKGYAEAHYGRALMLQQMGRTGEALAAYDDVLLHGTATAGLLHNRGAALQQLGRNAEALAGYADALVLAPAYIPALTARAQLLEELGRHDEALTAYADLLKASPEDATVWHNCAVILAAQGEAAAAFDGYMKALELRPDYAKALYGAASALQQLGRQDEALALCTLFLERTSGASQEPPPSGAAGAAPSPAASPEQAPSGAADVEALILQANLLHEAGRMEEALTALDMALRQAPEDARALCNKGVTLHELGRFDEAAACLDAAIAREPDFAGAWLGRGNLELKSARLDEALHCFERALGADPQYAKAACGKALVLREMGRFHEAAAGFEQSLALKPDLADARANYSAMQLLLGDFERGWEGYEYRYLHGEKCKAELTLPWPEWSGGPLAGKSIAVLDEAGMGDVLMLARYLPLLARMGAGVTFQCRASMHGVLDALRSCVRLADAGMQGESFDHCIPMFSLPRAFGTRAGTIPASGPYLQPDAARVAKWAERIGAGGFKIGVNWQGNPNPKVDISRSAPLAAFEPLAALKGVRLISLQKHSGLDQIASAEFKVETLGADFDSGPDAFVDTAAAMANLDLIVTVDTSIAHLAGALGRPVWVALKQVPEWRWMLEREDSPWYPSMRLFRQQTRGDWSDVFNRMAREAPAMRERTARSR